MSETLLAGKLLKYLQSICVSHLVCVYYSILQYTTFYDIPFCLVSYNVKVSELVDMFMGSTQKAVSLLHEDPEISKEEIKVCKTGYIYLTN